MKPKIQRTWAYDRHWFAADMTIIPAADPRILKQLRKAERKNARRALRKSRRAQ